MNPLFPTTRNDVGEFIKYTSLYYDVPPFGTVAAFDAPKIETIERLDPVNAAPRLGTVGTNVSPDAASNADTTGRSAHERLLDAIIAVVRSAGCDVEKLSGRGDNDPDGKIRPTELTALSETLGVDIEERYKGRNLVPTERMPLDLDAIHIEVEIANESKRGQLIKNINRAAAQNRLIIFVLESDDSVDKLADHLQMQYHTTPQREPKPALAGVDVDADARTDDIPPASVRLYNGDNIEPEQGRPVPVIPDNAGDCVWVATPRQEKILFINGHRVGSGPLGAATWSLEFDSPMVYKEEGKWVVRDQRGDVLGSYDTEAAFKSDWTLIKRPIVPVELSSLERSIILQETAPQSGEFDVVEPSPNQAKFDSSTALYEAILEPAAHRLTGIDNTKYLPKSAVQSRLLRLFRRITDHSEPNSRFTGRALPTGEDELLEAVESGQRHVDGERVQSYINLAWRFRPCLTADSPFAHLGQSPSELAPDDGE